MIFKKSINALLFWLIIYDFFSKYNRTGVFNQSGIGTEHAANFQSKMYNKFQKIQKQKKSLDLVEQKLVRLNKIEKI